MKYDVNDSQIMSDIKQFTFCLDITMVTET